MTRHKLLLLKAIAVTKQAGLLIRKWYKNDSCHRINKPNCSPLTEADLESHSFLVSALADTGIPVISEESELSYHLRKERDLFWLIDPLDGTKDFLERNGEFTVNVALIENNSPVLGVIHAPDIGLTYYALKGNGAFCEKEGMVRQLPCFTSHVSLVATVSRQHLSEATREFLKINGITRFEPKGSALKFGTVASGIASIYPRFEGSMEWDIAAGHIILSEAGCSITDLVTGTEPRYNKPSLLNNPFIVSAPYVQYKKLIMPCLDIS